MTRIVPFAAVLAVVALTSYGMNCPDGTIGCRDSTSSAATLAELGPGQSVSWQADDCYVGAPYNQQFNYSGGWNGMLLSITGDGFGGTIDLLDVNYVYLSIEP